VPLFYFVKYVPKVSYMIAMLDGSETGRRVSEQEAEAKGEII
jgi:hypothetical protein